MVYIVLIILTIISCLLFEYSGLPKTLKGLIASYKQQFKVMSDKELTDELKQKQLLQLISQQLLLIGKLVLGIFLFVTPFLSLFLLQKFNQKLNPDILITWWGFLIPVGTVLCYLLIKRYYGRLFGN